MTPLQFAKAQCCNYENDGTCTGVGYDNKGNPKRFSNGKTKCVLSDPAVRCGFFEECVIRMGVAVSEAKNAKQRVYLENLLAARDEAKRLYCQGTKAVV